jgi:hypothetical protein
VTNFDFVGFYFLMTFGLTIIRNSKHRQKPTARRIVKNELCIFCEPGRDQQPITRVRRKAGIIFLILQLSNSFVSLL